MKRDQATKLLCENATKLEKLGDARACLFSSVARDEAEEGSDVNVCVSPTSEQFSLFNLVRVKRFLESAFVSKVDVFTLVGLKNALPSMRKRIAAEILDAF